MANNHNFEHKYASAQEFCIPVRDNTETLAEQTDQAVNYSTKPTAHNLLPVLPFTSIHPAYTQTLQQYINKFPSYINPLVNYQMLNQLYQASEMDIETYINYEVNKQKIMMDIKHNAKPLRQIEQLQKQRQLQLPSIRNPLPKKKEQERRIINVEVVAMAGSTRDTGKPSDVEPLPPVKPEFKEHVAKIARSQQHYTQLFGRLTTMLQTLNSRYDGSEVEPEEEQLVQVDDDVPPPPLKRARHNMSSSSSDSHLDVENTNTKDISHYPIRKTLQNGNFAYVLGPNGTEISAKEYSEVFWTSAAIATRSLLAAVFTSDELATHTLTGKPSPAFYGRERPAKKMLDQRRVDDIVVSVRNRTGGKERNIRATITTKCADTAKKYKRRAKKANNSDNTIVLED